MGGADSTIAQSHAAARDRDDRPEHGRTYDLALAFSGSGRGTSTVLVARTLLVQRRASSRCDLPSSRELDALDAASMMRVASARARSSRSPAAARGSWSRARLLGARHLLLLRGSIASCASSKRLRRSRNTGRPRASRADLVQPVCLRSCFHRHVRWRGAEDGRASGGGRAFSTAAIWIPRQLPSSNGGSRWRRSCPAAASFATSSSAAL